MIVFVLAAHISVGDTGFSVLLLRIYLHPDGPCKAQSCSCPRELWDPKSSLLWGGNRDYQGSQVLLSRHHFHHKDRIWQTSCLNGPDAKHMLNFKTADC